MSLKDQWSPGQGPVHVYIALTLLSDAHGNAPALRACLAAAERCHPDTRYLPYREGTILRGLCERLMP